MASYQQLIYCKNCKKNTTLDDNNKCKFCGGTQFKKSWSVRFRVVDFNGEKQKRLTGFETKKLAESAYIDFMSTYTPATPTNKTSYIYEDVLKNYFTYCRTENKESTIYDKRGLFNMYITPYFTGQDISKISKENLVNWQTALWNTKSKITKNNFSWKYLTNIRGLLNNFLQFCENVYDIPNILKRIKIPKNQTQKKQIKFWELEDFNKFIATVDDIQYKTLWYVFMFTGARFNEVRALGDNDIKNGRIIINKSMATKGIGSALQITTTKNSKIVEKQIPDILNMQVLKYKQWKQSNNISPNFLFGGEKPLTNNMIRRRLVTHIKQANMPYISPHGFRHSYVSMLIHIGISSKIIAELIGDNEEQVIKTYGHLYLNAKDDAILLLDKHLK